MIHKDLHHDNNNFITVLRHLLGISYVRQRSIPIKEWRQKILNVGQNCFMGTALYSHFITRSSIQEKLTVYVRLKTETLKNRLLAKAREHEK